MTTLTAWVRHLGTVLTILRHFARRRAPKPDPIEDARLETARQMRSLGITERDVRIWRMASSFLDALGDRVKLDSERFRLHSLADELRTRARDVERMLQFTSNPTDGAP